MSKTGSSTKKKSRSCKASDEQTRSDESKVCTEETVMTDFDDDPPLHRRDKRHTEMAHQATSTPSSQPTSTPSSETVNNESLAKTTPAALVEKRINVMDRVMTKTTVSN